MKTFADNRIVSLFAKTGAAILAAVLVVSLCLASLRAPTVKADSEIVVSLNSNASNLGPGDIVLVDVLASKMPGITEFGPVKFCFDADKAARDVITAAGYGENFGHGTGHGVGIEIHEFPSLSPKSKSILKEGNVVTVEPGIYLPGLFGVRIEDMALITKDGHKNLTSSPKELIIL